MKQMPRRKMPKSGRKQKVKAKKITTRDVKSKPVVPTEGKYKGKRVYRKRNLYGSDIHEVDYARDRKRKAKRVRTRSEPSYTGDLKGSKV